MSLKVVKFDTKTYFNFSNFRGRTSAGGGQALVQKRGQVSDGGIGKIFAGWGDPQSPQEKTLPVIQCYHKLARTNSLQLGSNKHANYIWMSTKAPSLTNFWKCCIENVSCTLPQPKYNKETHCILQLERAQTSMYYTNNVVFVQWHQILSFPPFSLLFISFKCLDNYFPFCWFFALFQQLPWWY